jgi:ribosome-associated translation inhibitor RaiA
MDSTQITLRNVKPSTALARRIREKCDALEKFHPNVLHCRVTLERDDTAAPFCVTLRIGVPGDEIVVSHARHHNAHLALRDAFAAARRRLKDAASIARHEVKPHSQPAMEV